jgi:hypothetical protein
MPVVSMRIYNNIAIAGVITMMSMVPVRVHDIIITTMMVNTPCYETAGRGEEQDS